MFAQHDRRLKCIQELCKMCATFTVYCWISLLLVSYALMYISPATYIKCDYVIIYIVCFVMYRSCVSAGPLMGTAHAVRSVCSVWAHCGRSAATVWVGARVVQLWPKVLRMTQILIFKVCCLSLYDGNLHILQNVMKSDQMNCKVPLCHTNELNPQKTFPLHFSPATKGPADIMSVILSLTHVSVDGDKAGDHSVMLIEFE